MNLKKIFIFFLAVIFSWNTFAQHSISSPYSMFGIGYLEQGGVGRSRALGGAGIALPSEYSLNSLNPASYRFIDSTYFLMDFGVTGNYSMFKNNTKTRDRYDASFSYLAIGFRINSWWANSIGLTPYSSVGYNISSTKEIVGMPGTFSNVALSGSGGLNQFYWGNSFKITKNLAIGATASYIFGSIVKSEKVSSSYYNGQIRIEDESRINNFNFKFGTQYFFKVNDDWSGSIGAVYSNKTRLNGKHDFRALYSADTLYKDVSQYKDYYIPETFGFGASIQFKNNIMLTGDYTQSNWSSTSQAGSGYELVDSRRFSAGVEFIPSVKASARYFQVLHYRLGGYIGDSYLKIYGDQMKDYGVTFGAGFPFMRGKTIINLAFSAGMTGVPGSSTVINENFYRVHLNVSLFDFWFNKIKYE